ncbi:CCA tRNA nucleotidyltransferase [Candidatus Micrarchaeota archaeon]|nr:CCA tRNA nucleotidyltransferase [Candidatus Micrarchaeota archaeon]
MEKILKTVLKKISPGKKEIEEIEGIKRKIMKKIELPKGTKLVATGSVAKETFIKGEKDLDLFALFPKKYSKERMFRVLKKAVEKAFPKERKEEGYAEHPYIKLYLKGIRIDVVPAYFMKKGERIASSVDRTQLHTEYINKRFSRGRKKEVLLLKRFLKANNLYGAEIKIKGFSGYLCELLVLQYGNFKRLVEEASKWRIPAVLQGRGFEDANLVFQDPVDPKRNVGAVISREVLSKFIYLCQCFLKKPAMSFFYPKEKKIEKWRKIIVINVEKPPIVDDVLWGQVHRLKERISGLLKKKGFGIIGMYAEEEKGITLLYEFEELELPEVEIRKGPMIWMKENAEEFKKKYKTVIIKEQNLCALSKRKKRKIKEFYKDIRNIKAPSHLGKGLKKAGIYSGKQAGRFRKTISSYLL